VGHYGFHGRIYRAVMKGLTPGLTYYYRVGDRRGIVSRTFYFRAAGAVARPRLVMFGDMGVLPLGFEVNKDIEF
jgi:hypothetical protein